MWEEIARWARSPMLWFVIWLVNTNMNYCCQSEPSHYRAAKDQSCSLLPALGQHWQVSKRAEGATMPSAVISTFREGIWAIVHKSEQRELWFPPSAITPKLLFCHLTLRKEKGMWQWAGNNFLRTRSSGIYVLCILTRVVTLPCLLNYIMWI